MLPSINTICFDGSAAARISSEPEDLRIRRAAPHWPETGSPSSFNGQRVSTIRKNPLYPVTLPLIQQLVAEDRAQFGRLPPLIPRCPDLTVISPSPFLNGPLSPSPPPSVSPVSRATLSSSLAAMANSSLPPRKRRLLQSAAEDDLSGQRGSVIQFGIRA